MTISAAEAKAGELESRRLPKPALPADTAEICANPKAFCGQFWSKCVCARESNFFTGYSLDEALAKARHFAEFVLQAKKILQQPTTASIRGSTF